MQKKRALLVSKEERRKDKEQEKRKQAELELLLMDDAALRYDGITGKTVCGEQGRAPHYHTPIHFFGSMHNHEPELSIDVTSAGLSCRDAAVRGAPRDVKGAARGVNSDEEEDLGGHDGKKKKLGRKVR